MLGDTLEIIASEKAGIIKPTYPVVIGRYRPSLYPIFANCRENNNAQVHFSTEFTSKCILDIPLLGDYQLENCRTVLKSCEVFKN